MRRTFIGSAAAWLAAIGIGALALSTAAFAQAYPQRPVTVVVPYAPGGAGDVVARLLGVQLEKELGQAFVIENRAGASTMLGADFVRRADKDGYTLLFTAATTFVTNPHLFAKITYRYEDFAPISLVGRVPFVFAVKKTFPAKTIGDFVTHVGQKPGEVFYGTLGRGSITHIVGELMNAELKIKMADVPYKGAAPAMNDILSGNLDTYVESVANATPLHNNGDLKVIGIMSQERSKLLPDVPTFAEAGYPGVLADSWLALFAPQGTPQPIIDRLNAAVHKAAQSPQFIEAMAKIGNTVQPTTPAELSALVKAESDKWGAVINTLGIKLD
ncbi:Bug family tripartite tricarboxylate transporter substrate binding protein [Microvirga pudoricolor]|uniref:Bug family tripartite tricarboxylate transporter substrate binding protein n=1 Tax=Microvirga pudoricolor TaxID=2778729 RepID=UPI0019501AC4|nr:tripartite tricarboxylate transporter substrate binding protein [Microvirga pudoricolor]MBM6594684.1 tripartite tricarboxylate transporter substrate binding protein [Microvirga pudoricolor]